MATNEKKMSRLSMALIGAVVILALGLGSCQSTKQQKGSEPGPRVDPTIDVGDGSITFEYTDGVTANGNQVEAQNDKLKVRTFELLDKTTNAPYKTVDLKGSDWTFTSDKIAFELHRKDHQNGDNVSAPCPGANWVVNHKKATCDPPGNIRVWPATLTIKNENKNEPFDCPPSRTCILRLRFK